MLRCIKDFRQYEHDFKAGDVIQTSPSIEAWLLDSFPAYFERTSPPVEVETADVQAPPADKAIKRPRGRK